jgi:wyosine [tRNA(Phe)-imidazoG37] synthetase (radical SAM superfamily)
VHKHVNDVPNIEAVINDVENALKSSLEFNYLTFSGNGEPTLHPHFREIVTAVVALRNKYRPDARIALLSNSSGSVREEVRMSIANIDLPVFKLDAGTEETFMEINRPAKDISLLKIVESLKVM